MNDDRLISLNAAIDALNKRWRTCIIGESLIRDAGDTLKALPSAQLTGTNTVQVEDCISRAAIVDAIDGVDWYHQNDSGEMVHGANSAEDQPWYKAEDIYAAIEGVPPVQPVEDARAMCGECDAWNQYKNPQPGWIPCCTEMPPTGKNVLVTLVDGAVTDGKRWKPQEGKWFLFSDGVNGLDEDVLAWMPLPAPWEGGKE